MKRMTIEEQQMFYIGELSHYTRLVVKVKRFVDPKNGNTDVWTAKVYDKVDSSLFRNIRDDGDIYEVLCLDDSEIRMGKHTKYRMQKGCATQSWEFARGTKRIEQVVNLAMDHYVSSKQWELKHITKRSEVKFHSIQQDILH